MTIQTSAPVRAAVRAITRACTWTVGLRHTLKTYTLTDDECEAAGIPLGSSEVWAYAFPLVGAQGWRADAWSDGDCFQLRALGWAMEAHHEPREVAPAVA